MHDYVIHTALGCKPGIDPINVSATSRRLSITRKAFLICLAIAGGGCLWLAGLIGKWGVERVPSIGGGSYSLDAFVYSGLILLWTGLWALGALIAGLARADAGKATRAFLLAGIALVAFGACCWLYGHNLS